MKAPFLLADTQLRFNWIHRTDEKSDQENCVREIREADALTKLLSSTTGLHTILSERAAPSELLSAIATLQRSFGVTSLVKTCSEFAPG